MRKLISKIILVLFFILSQIQLVHAVDMGENMTEPTHHEKIREDNPIFCETGADNHRENCAQKIFPSIIVPGNSNNNADKIIILAIFGLPKREENPGIGNTLYGGIYSPPKIIYQKQEYTNLIGVLKDLN